MIERRKLEVESKFTDDIVDEARRSVEIDGWKVKNATDLIGHRRDGNWLGLITFTIALVWRRGA